MKPTILIISLISAISFATIFMSPAAPAEHAAKAWAHGVCYILPRITVTLVFGIISAVLIGIDIRKNGLKKTLIHPIIIGSLILLLPALYTMVVMIRIIIASTI